MILDRSFFFIFGFANAFSMEPCSGATCELTMSTRGTGETELYLNEESLLDFENSATEVPGCPTLWKCCALPQLNRGSTDLLVWRDEKAASYQCIPPRVPKLIGGRGQSCKYYSPKGLAATKADAKNCAHETGSRWKKDQVMNLYANFVRTKTGTIKKANA